MQRQVAALFIALFMLCAGTAAQAAQYFYVDVTATNFEASNDATDAGPLASVSFRLRVSPEIGGGYARFSSPDITVQYPPAFLGDATTLLAGGDDFNFPAFPFGILILLPGANDFFFLLEDIGTPDQAGFFAYSRTDLDDVYQSSDLAVTISPAPAPEPGTWAMLIIGAGLVGAAFRARRVRGAALAVA